MDRNYLGVRDAPLSIRFEVQSLLRAINLGIVSYTMILTINLSTLKFTELRLAAYLR